MRMLALPGLLALVSLLPRAPALARPEFARREGKACGFCHINPRGGGTRNQAGLAYARNEFRFPPPTVDLKDFERERDRKAMIRVRKLIGMAHVRAAVTDLKRLSGSAVGDAAKRACKQALHDLDVKGTEILGQARRLLRGKEAEGRAEGIELLVLLKAEYKDLDVHAEALADLKKLRKEKAQRERIAKEERESKARALYLDALVLKVDGQAGKANRLFAKIVKSYTDTRVAKPARKELKPADDRGS
ncbi:MAG: hypothetical protein ACYTGV_02285 [Planctomycetota bacterium]|jgi:hypothetical protein